MHSPNHSTDLVLARVRVGGLSCSKDVQTGLRSWKDGEDQPQPRAFEFINVNDKDGSRRAKSHAVKDSRRRQKFAESTRLQRLKVQCAQKIIAAGPVQVVDTPARLPPVSITYLDRPKLDQFNILPAKLNCHRDMELVHSYHTRFLPKSFEVTKTNYAPFRELTLSVAIQDPSSFYMVVSGSAESIALATKKTISRQAILYRGKAMELINDRMKSTDGALSDGAISACSVLAGFELLFGTPATYEVHMDGLCQMIKLRGGFQSIQKSNPQLAALVAWHDFAGVANLAGKRRFELASYDSTVSRPTQPLRFTPPVTCPGKIPRNYTLYEDLLIVLDGLESATLLQHSPTELRRKEFTRFVESLNDDLIRTVVPYPNHTTPSRRYLIEDSYRLAALIYISAMCGKRMIADWNDACRTFLDDLSSSILDINSDWGYTIEMILKLVMRGGRVRSQENIYYTVQIMNFSIPMDWHQWKGIRDALFGYLINAKICAGSHQDFWVCTMDII